jgi:hypothetical protein
MSIPCGDAINIFMANGKDWTPQGWIRLTSLAAQ